MIFPPGLVLLEFVKDGLKEVRTGQARHDSQVEWRLEEDWSSPSLPHNIGQHPTVMDPHERKSVLVKNSLIPGSNEGLFAR